MQEIEGFRKPLMEDVELLRNCFMAQRHMACDYSSGNIILWSKIYNTEIAYIKDMLIVKFSRGKDTFFTFPSGIGNHIEAIQWLEAYCQAEGIDLKFGIMEPEMYAELKEMYPGRFSIEYCRDNADYIYLVEKLASLSGKAYHGKKNHVNKFMKTHEDWSYEKMSRENMEECIQMVQQWCIENGCCDDRDKAAEICVCIDGIRWREELGLTGGLIRTGDGIVALTLGEPLNQDTFVIHFEKAFSGIQGAYPMINQQFILHELMGYKYVNREEDMGLDGLRKAKESYKPVMMAEKGFAVSG
ncbi:MAG: DUF2156 domain-containing protein [Lachnospiraceae bacterium]|nr:DUF2156 domain-containing protein [Lachnospiraceae bacterium]